MTGAGRWLIVIGAGFVGLGLYLTAGGRLPPLGHLPGDIVIHRGNTTIYIPITTMILMSLALSAALWVVGWWTRR